MYKIIYVFFVVSKNFILFIIKFLVDPMQTQLFASLCFTDFKQKFKKKKATTTIDRNPSFKISYDRKLLL